jgi:uncharacterized protein YkwD
MILRALIRILVLMAVFLTVGFYASLTDKSDQEILINEDSSPSEMDNQAILEKQETTGYSSPERPKEGLSILIGKDMKALHDTLGEPQRIDATAYGYEWYIYNIDKNQYVQVGVEGNKVVTLYTIGKEVNAAPFKIGQPVEEIFVNLFIDADVNIEYNGSSYKFELNDTDVNIRPLIKLGDIYAQIYIDKFTGSLSSVRFIDALTIIKERPYEMVYRGELIEPETIMDNKWLEIEEGTKKQIFDLTNILRVRHDLEPLEWDEETAEVAYGHSKDMEETADFSHTSKKYGDLSDRLLAAHVSYQLAGENIAANYTDGPAVVEGWLNSKGHRESLLNEEYTHLGVGVYHRHYTQNFIQKREE